jgi:glucosamine--fructose-6-phosphate aminotransferase (isomerizing)
LLRLAGIEAWAVQAADAALYGPRPGPDDALILISHRGTMRYTMNVQRRAQETGVPTVVISRRSSAAGADLETVENEASSAHTASYLGALMRLAQLAVALGADLGDLEGIPDAVAAELDAPPPGVTPPQRLLAFIGAGTNQWTAAEGALKTTEATYLATEGLSVEQFLHGYSLKLREGDSLVCLDGSGPMTERLEMVAHTAEGTGASVYRYARPELGEPLSIFPLTVIVQRIALDCATALGTNPDIFGADPAAWAALPL